MRDEALAAERAGEPERAQAIMGRALDAFPTSAALANSAGNLAMRASSFEAAERYFTRASQIVPQEVEFAVNRAIALSRLGRHAGAIAVLEPHRQTGRNSAQYCSVRGASERAMGNAEAAAHWYDKCLALEPRRPRGLHGRARVALERGESDALRRFEEALAVNPGDPELWLGKAQALDVAGRAAEAREIANALAAQAPQWLDGLRFLAQLRLAAGERDCISHYADAAQRAPEDPRILVAHITELGGLDRESEAAEIAASARKRFPGEPHFALLEAVHAGAAGDDDRAEAIYAALELESPERHVQEARHRIRRKQPEAAAALLDQALEAEPWSVGGWALRGLVWRMLDDPRSEWLHGQPGMVTLLPLQGAEEFIPAVTPLLQHLHDGSPLPLGQSLRGGTQTRGILFQRHEPELRALHGAILASLEAYRAQLPSNDERHPVLRSRDAPWRLEGSWSVRLSGRGDFHTAHIHPQGIVSSALYLELPPPAEEYPQAGWLEIGRPPPDLRLDLPPLWLIEPKVGHLALFPSTLYHGTRPFQAAQRLTVAFDVAARDAGPT